MTNPFTFDPKKVTKEHGRCFRGDRSDMYVRFSHPFPFHDVWVEGVEPRTHKEQWHAASINALEKAFNQAVAQTSAHKRMEYLFEQEEQEKEEELENIHILAMTPEKCLDEAKANGEDTAGFAKRMNDFVKKVAS
jgi:hypothetical protein